MRLEHDPLCLRLALMSGLAAIVLLLAGCAGSQAFREGNALLAEGKVQQGLAKLDESVRLEPRNLEYRMALASRRTAAVDRLVLAGDGARRDGRLGDAEKAYRQVHMIDEENAMASQGLVAVAVARRHQQVIAEAEEKLKKGGVADLNAGLELLRQVLSENPKNRAALNLILLDRGAHRRHQVRWHQRHHAAADQVDPARGLDLDVGAAPKAAWKTAAARAIGEVVIVPSGRE